MRLKDLGTEQLSVAVWACLVHLGFYTQNCSGRNAFIGKAHFYFTRKQLYIVLKYLRKCIRANLDSACLKFSELPQLDLVICFINNLISRGVTYPEPLYILVGDVLASPLQFGVNYVSVRSEAEE